MHMQQMIMQSKQASPPSISVSAHTFSLDQKEHPQTSMDTGRVQPWSRNQPLQKHGHPPSKETLLDDDDANKAMSKRSSSDDNKDVRDEEGDASTGGGGGGGGDNKYSYQGPQHQQPSFYPPPHQQQQLPSFQYQQPSLQQQQQAQLFQQQQQLYQQQQQRNLNPGTPAQYPPPDSSSFPFSAGGGGSAYSSGGAGQSSEFNRELARHLANSNTPGGHGPSTGLAGGIPHHATTPMGAMGGMGGGGGFGMMGQTPMTAASFGSSVGAPTPSSSQGGGMGGMMGSGILKASNYPGPMHMGGMGGPMGQSQMMEMQQGGGGGGGLSQGSGLLRGNDPLQPTPVVRRGGPAQQMQQHQQQMQQSMMMQGTPSPGMHYHQTGMLQSEMKSGYPPHPQQPMQSSSSASGAQSSHAASSRTTSQQQHRMKRKLEPVMEEEDPSMLRYESSIRSPMAAAGEKEEEGEEPPQQRMRSERKDSSRRQSSGSIQQESKSPRYSQEAQDPSSSTGNPSELQRGTSAQSQGQQQNPGGSSTGAPPILNEFPFFFDGYAAWVCRHCQHVPPYYRGGNYVWQAANPPPNQFVDLHLRFCPGLNPGNMPPPAGSSQAQQFAHQQQMQMQQQQAGFGGGGMQQQGIGMQEGGAGGGGGGGFPSYPMQQTMMHSSQGPSSYMQHQMQQQEQMMMQRALSHQSSGSGGNQEQKMIEASKDDHQEDSSAPDPPGAMSPQRPSGKQQDQDSKVKRQGSEDREVSSRELVPMSGGAPREGGHQGGGGVHWDFPQGGRPPHSYQGGQLFNPWCHHHPGAAYPSQMMQMPGMMGGGAGMPYPQMPMPPPPAAAARGGGGGDVRAPESSTPPKAKRKSTSTKISPKGRRTDDATYNAAITFLAKKTIDMARPHSPSTDIGQSLIDQSDADLLTDYFYHMMQQLVVCRFSEKDRKTRGGKRENINIGYGGLQCIHCIEAPSSRKFFWSTVDRLANSFAEIPSHVLKCKHCPDDIKDALLALKGRHPDQMQMLPRGSQKVFFRRMWRRLHDGDNEAATPVKERRPSSSLEEQRGQDPPPSALKSPKIAAPAAASILAKSAKKSAKKSSAAKIKLESKGSGESASSSEGSDSTPEDKRSRVLLAIPEDKDWLSDMDCFVRSQIEIFSSKQPDVENAADDRKYPIKLGQVGIRCVHCAGSTEGARGAAVSYPYSISGIYESVREFQRLHLESCPNIPQDLKEASNKLGSGAASLSSVLRRYYVQAARALGLYDTHDNGIRAGGTPVPMSTAGFQSPASKFRPTAKDAPGTMPDEDRKRKASEDEEESGSKRAKVEKEDAPGLKSTDSPKERDAPAKGEVPGIEDAPGEKA